MSPDCCTRVGLVLTLQKGTFALVLSSVFNDPRAGGGVVLPEFKAPCVTCSKFLILSKPDLIPSEELNELCVSVCVRYTHTCVCFYCTYTPTHIFHACVSALSTVNIPQTLAVTVLAQGPSESPSVRIPRSCASLSVDVLNSTAQTRI